jgi:CheY-like chemotaxis protein
MADDTSTPNIRFPNWQLEYQAALLEVDPQKLHERVKAAEAAIFLRQQALANSPDGQAERQAIEDAMHALRFLQTEKLGYPDWKK